jgi:hypothetical protein
MPPETIDPLRMLVIYRRPLDYPDHYVVRAQLVYSCGHIVPEHLARVFEVDTSDEGDALEMARAYCRARSSTCLGRFPDDDPVIVETWI